MTSTTSETVAATPVCVSDLVLRLREDGPFKVLRAQSADLIEAQEHANLALSERVAGLEKYRAAAEAMICHRWNPDHSDEPDDFMRAEDNHKEWRAFLKARAALTTETDNAG